MKSVNYAPLTYLGTYGNALPVAMPPLLQPTENVQIHWIERMYMNFVLDADFYVQRVILNLEMLILIEPQAQQVSFYFFLNLYYQV